MVQRRLMKLPGVRASLSLWCTSEPHKLLVKVFSKFVEFGLNSVDTETKQLKPLVKFRFSLCT